MLYNSLTTTREQIVSLHVSDPAVMVWIVKSYEFYINESNETIAKNIINMENKDFCYIKQEVKSLGRVKVAQFPTAVKCLMNFLYSFIGL